MAILDQPNKQMAAILGGLPKYQPGFNEGHHWTICAFWP